MLKTLHRSALLFYNYSSVLCLNYESQKYKVSNFKAFCNLCKVPSMLFIIAFTNYIVVLRDEIYLPSFLVLDDYSRLAKFSLICIVLLIHVTTFLLCILHVMMRHEIKNFLNTALDMKLRPKYFSHFIENCVKDAKFLSSVFLFNHVVQYLGTMRLTLWSFLASLLLLFPSVALVGFVSFVKNFENYVAAMLRELKNDVKKIFLQKQNCDVAEFMKLSIKYQKTCDLVIKFSECFGRQLTVITCFTTAANVLHVRRK